MTQRRIYDGKGANFLDGAQHTIDEQPECGRTGSGRKPVVRLK